MPISKDQREEREETRNEEVRGLFVLGLLAALVSLRFQSKEMPFSTGQFSGDVTLFLDATIVFWSLYAFFTVLGLSKEMIGEWATTFRELAQVSLFLTYVFLGFFHFPSSFTLFQTAITL